MHPNLRVSEFTIILQSTLTTVNFIYFLLYFPSPSLVSTTANINNEQQHGQPRVRIQKHCDLVSESGENNHPARHPHVNLSGRPGENAGAFYDQQWPSDLLRSPSRSAVSIDRAQIREGQGQCDALDGLLEDDPGPVSIDFALGRTGGGQEKSLRPLVSATSDSTLGVSLARKKEKTQVRGQRDDINY